MSDDFIFIYWDEPFINKKEDEQCEESTDCDSGSEEN
jgi:hypothetical protein